MAVLNKACFFEIQKNMLYISPFQDLSWMSYIDIEENYVRYFVDSLTNPKICCWGRVTIKVPGIKILTIVGESTSKKLSISEIKFFLETIIQYGRNNYSLIKISSESSYDINFEIAAREAGFLRPFVYSNCPLSVIINLDAQIDRSGDWKRNYKAALKNGLKFRYVETPDANDLGILFKLHAQMIENKNISGNLKVDLVNQLIQNSKFHLFICYTNHDEPLCARIVYWDRDFSYDIIAANGTASRINKGSSHFLLENIFSWLKIKGCKSFDFGRIGPGKSSSNSVYEFKRCSGGTLVSLNGEWVYPVKKWVEYLYFLKMPRKW